MGDFCVGLGTGLILGAIIGVLLICLVIGGKE